MSTKKEKQYNLSTLNKKHGSLSVGEFLKAWRLSDEMTQVEFAKLLGISAANLCDIEKGRKGVSVEKAKEFADILGYSPTVLVGLALVEQVRSAGLNYEVEVKLVKKKNSAVG